MFSNASISVYRTNGHNGDFDERLSMMQMWFIRAAWVSRVKFVEELLIMTKSLEVIGQILNMTRANILKECIYIGAQYTTDNLFDKVLFDDDRILSCTTAYLVKEKDLLWFGKLSNAKQYQVILALLKTGGGALMRAIFFYAYDLWNQRQNEEKRTDSIKPLLHRTETDGMRECYVNKHSSDMNSSYRKSSGFQSRFFDLMPIPSIVKTNRENWETRLRAIKRLARLPSVKSCLRPVTTQASKTKRKNSKRQKQARKQKMNDDSSVLTYSIQNRSRYSLDYIQLLPIWINRRIISMLDPESIRNAQQVNRYWSMLVDSVLREMEFRQELNKSIDILQRKRTMKSLESRSTFEFNFQQSPKTQRFSIPQPPKTTDEVIKWRDFYFSDSKTYSFGKYSSDRFFRAPGLCKISVDTNRHLIVTNSSKSTMLSLYSLTTGMDLRNKVNVIIVQKKVTTFFLYVSINKLFVGFEYGYLCAYHLWTKNQIMRYPGHQTDILTISAIHDVIISCSTENILVHDIISSLQLSIVNCVNAHIVRTVEGSNFYYAGFSNGELRKYSFHNSKPLASIIAHSGCVTSIELDDIALVTSGIDHFVRIWDFISMSNRCYRCLEHDSAVLCVTLCGHNVISGTKNSFVYIWSMISGLKIRMLDPFKVYTLIPSYTMQIYSFYHLNTVKIIVSKDSEVKILEFRQYSRKTSSSDVDICEAPKQLKASMRGTNLFKRFEAEIMTSNVTNLRLNRRDQRLALLKMRGSADDSLRGNVGAENTIKSVPNAMGSRLNSQSFARVSMTTQKHQAYTFPRCIVDRPSAYVIPCDLSKKIERPPTSSIERRFEKKSMLQILNPYKVLI